MNTSRTRQLLRIVMRDGVVVVSCMLIGLFVGIGVASVSHEYQATAVVAVRSTSDVGQTSYAVLTAASTITGGTVIGNAAKALGMSDSDLAARVTATPQLGTTLIDVVASADTPEQAINEASAVARSAIDDYRTRSAATATEVQRAGEEQVSSGRLGTEAAEAARLGAIGAEVGAAQGAAIAEAATLSVRSAATDATRVGVNATLGALFGAAAGALVGIMVALAGVARGRRRVRRRSDLIDFLHIAQSDSQRGFIGTMVTAPPSTEVTAGELIETGRSCVILVTCGAPSSSTTTTAVRLGALLERAGITVASLVLSDAEVMVGSAVSGAPSVEPLSRVWRADLPARAATDVVLVTVPSSDARLDLLAGQSDFAAVVLVTPGTRVGDIEATLANVESAPTFVLVGSR